MPTPLLLSIVEMGGYLNYASLYQQKGFAVEQVDSMRKATKLLKKQQPAVVVAEFNFQSDFRDRTSSLETLMATVQRIPGCKVIVFYEAEQRPQLERLLAVFDVFSTIAFPVQEPTLSDALDRALEQTS
ncbi:hypothetical protein MNBD_GAMMA07-271 [hydrothermal vent metagenome]|uniref:Response regulatory domain-containing protein n=1 Tax=hydrothermal vent metagenome TaxID=652676 RepID=A0A3B0X497_9ZZZZ